MSSGTKKQIKQDKRAAALRDNLRRRKEKTQAQKKQAQEKETELKD